MIKLTGNPGGGFSNFRSSADKDDVATLETTVTLVTAVSPQVVAAAFEHLVRRRCEYATFFPRDTWRGWWLHVSGGVAVVAS